MYKRTAALIAVTLFFLPLPHMAAQALPDSPSASMASVSASASASAGWHVIEPDPASPSRVTFWTFRRSWQDPPLRTNRQFLTSKSIWIAAGADFAAMAVACSRRGTGEDLHTELPAQLGVLGLAYVGDRLFTRAFAVGPLLYAAVHYAVAARK